MSDSETPPKGNEQSESGRTLLNYKAEVNNNYWRRGWDSAHRINPGTTCNMFEPVASSRHPTTGYQN